MPFLLVLAVNMRATSGMPVLRKGIFRPVLRELPNSSSGSSLCISAASLLRPPF